MEKKISKKRKIKNCFCTKTLKTALQTVLLYRGRPGQSFYHQLAMQSLPVLPSFKSNFLRLRLTSIIVTSVPTKVAGWSSIRPPSRWEHCGCAPRRTWRGWVATIAVVPFQNCDVHPHTVQHIFPHIKTPTHFMFCSPFVFGMSFLGDSTCACCSSDNLSKVPCSGPSTSGCSHQKQFDGQTLCTSTITHTENYLWQQQKKIHPVINQWRSKHITAEASAYPASCALPMWPTNMVVTNGSK